MIRNLLCFMILLLILNISYAQSNKSPVTKNSSYSAKPIVRINSNFCKLIIKASEEQQVKIMSSVNGIPSEQNIFGKNLEINELDDRIDIYVNPSLKEVVADENKTSSIDLMQQWKKALLLALDKNQSSSIAPLKELIIYLPRQTVLNITSRYGDVVIHPKLEKAIINIQNGILDASDIHDLNLKGDYCNAHLGNVKKAVINYENGTLRALEIEDLYLESESSVIDYVSGKNLYLVSRIDEISVQTIEEVNGRSTWGTISINKLKKSLTLQGANTDLKIRNIQPSVEYVEVNNKRAQMHISLRYIENYMVEFSGKSSNTITPFQKTQLPGTADQPDIFRGSKGNVNVQHTRIKVNCDSCLIDFK